MHGNVSYLVKYIGNISVDQSEGYEVLKEACRKIQLDNKNKKPVNVRINISTSGIVLQSKRKDLHFNMNDITYSKQYYQSKKENGTETDKIFAFIGKPMESNGALNCYLFQSNDHAKVVDLTIKQAKEIDLATKLSQVGLENQRNGSDYGYISEDESLNSSLETSSIATSEEDASMKSSLDMESITSDEDSQEVRSNYSDSETTFSAQMLAEQMRKYYFDESIKNQVYVHDRSKINVQSSGCEKPFAHPSPQTTPPTSMSSFKTRNPYMVHSNPFPYQNTQVSKAEFQYPSNEVVQQNYTYLNNQKYETSRPHVETYANNYSQQDNRDNVQYNFWQHQSSPNTTSPTNGLREYSNVENYMQSQRHRNSIENYNLTNGQRNSMDNYNLPNGQRSSMENFNLLNGQRNSIENYNLPNGQRNSMDNFNLPNDQRNSMENFNLPNGHRNSLENFNLPNDQRSSMETYNLPNDQRRSFERYMQPNNQRRSMEDYFQSSLQRKTWETEQNNFGSYIQSNEQRSKLRSHIPFTRQQSNIVDYGYVRFNKQKNNMDEYMAGNSQRSDMEDYRRSNKAVSEDGSVAINNIWATWAGFSRPVMSFGYGDFSAGGPQEIVRPRSY
jgi:hypothetical protein